MRVGSFRPWPLFWSRRPHWLSALPQMPPLSLRVATAFSTPAGCSRKLTCPARIVRLPTASTAIMSFTKGPLDVEYAGDRPAPARKAEWRLAEHLYETMEHLDPSSPGE